VPANRGPAVALGRDRGYGKTPVRAVQNHMSRRLQLLDRLQRLRTQVSDADERARELDAILDLASDVLGTSETEAGRLARLEALLGELRATERAKNEVLSIAAYDIRNALGPIVAATQLLGTEEGSLVRHSMILERHTRHLTMLVDNMLEMALATSGHATLLRTLVDLQDVLARSIEVASPFIIDRKLVLSSTTEDEALWVHADRERLIQVFTNLLVNAAKSTPAGGEIRIEIGASFEEIFVRFVDSGAGIAREVLSHVFELFSPEKKRGTGFETPGFGIGLAVVRNVLELHGGGVEAASEGPGRGSTFVVRLPRARGEDRAELKTMPDATLDMAPPLHGRTVLVVDDHEDAAETFAEMLEHHGCTVHVAHDGRAALEIAHGTKPDVVLLDLGLPGMDGYDVARRLRADRTLEGTKIVAVTGYGEDSDRQRSLSAGMDAHLVKPIDTALLLEMVRAHR